MDPFPVAPTKLCLMILRIFSSILTTPEAFGSNFRIDNTDHIFDVNKKQHDHDQVDLVCPQQQLHQQQQQQQQLNISSDSNRTSSSNSSLEIAQQERYIIYSVSKDEYDTCRVNGNGRIVAVCDQPLGAKPRPPVTVTFRSYTPQPNGFEYKAGQDYYFITALIGYHSDPVRRFAPCREQNMKVIFKVCCRSSSSSSASSPSATLTSNPNQAATAIRLANTGPNGSPSTRRPAVITLRPALVAGANSNKQPSASPQLDDYFRAISSSSGSSSAPQPITVLPIEVLQSSGSDNNNSNDNNSLNDKPAASGSSEQSGASSQALSDPEKNDINVQNEQQQPAPAPPPTPTRAPRPLPERSPSSLQQPAFFPFDPTAPPEVIRSYERWTPTPLPPALTGAKSGYPTFGRFPAARLHQHPFHLEPAQQPWQHSQLQQQAPQLSRQPAPGSSRISFYPPSLWSSSQAHDQTNGPTRDLISVLDSREHQQSPSSASATTYGAPALPALLMLILLLLVAFARQQRHQH